MIKNERKSSLIDKLIDEIDEKENGVYAYPLTSEEERKKADHQVKEYIKKYKKK